jgi:alpha-beta hydrolase superfamily lysophospholipase
MLAQQITAQIRSVKCADGYVLHYRRWSSAVAPSAVLVLLNGVMSHSGWFQPLADQLVPFGLTLVGADRRGTGMNERARGDAPSAKLVVDDVLQIVRAERLAGMPVHLAGWCWGAVLAINAAAMYERELASLALLAPGLYPSEAVQRAMASQDALARSPDTAYLDVPIPDEMFTRGPFLAFIAQDQLRTRRVSVRFQGIMRKLAMGATLRLRDIECPILLVLAGADEATDNVRTRREFERLARPPVRVEIIDGAHGLQFESPATLGRVLASWTATLPSQAGADRAN